MPQLNFNALASNAPQSVFQGFMQGQQLQNQLAQQQQQRQLAEMQLQSAAREQRMAGEEEAAWKAGAGRPEQVLQELQQRGLGKQAMALQSQLSKQQADKLAQQKTQVELVKNAANQVFANPANAAQILQAFGQRTGIDMRDDLAQIQQFGGNLDAIKQWAAGHAMEADKLLPKFEKFDQGAAVVTGTVDPLTGKFIQGQAYKKEMTPGEVASNRIAQGQLGVAQGNLTLNQAKAAREADPAFQQQMAAAKATGEAIAKGNAAAKQALPKIISDAEMAVDLVDQMIGKQEVRDAKTGKVIQKATPPHPGFENAVGFGLGQRFISGTDAAGFQALQDQVEGTAFLSAFEALRGGGAISDAEGKKATAARMRMSLAQDEKSYIKAAREFQDVVRKGVEIARRKASGAAPATGAPSTGAKFLGFE